jgi:hypothetical protein
MSIKRQFIPEDGGEKFNLQPVLPGRHDFFRDYLKDKKLGKLVMTECSHADSGGLVTLYSHEIQLVNPADELIVPLIEIEEGETVITLEEGDSFKLPVRMLEYGEGEVLFEHDNTPRLILMREAA